MLSLGVCVRVYTRALTGLGEIDRMRGTAPERVVAPLESRNAERVAAEGATTLLVRASTMISQGG